MANPMSALNGSSAAPDWEIRDGSVGILVQFQLNLRGTQSRNGLRYIITAKKKGFVL